MEAAIVLPLCLVFLMNLGCAIEMIRLHNNLQLALWDSGSGIALYGYEQGDNGVASLASTIYVKSKVKIYLGEGYLDTSPLIKGSDGLCFWEGEMLQGDLLDIKLTYGVKPMISLVGFSKFRMANRFYVHLWNGYEISNRKEQTVMVYVAENGSVCHKDRECTHIRLSIRQILHGQLVSARNQWGSKYAACEKCVVGQRPDILYITDDGQCYHYWESCPGLRRTVRALTLEEAAGYPYCSRCGGE